MERGEEGLLLGRVQGLQLTSEPYTTESHILSICLSLLPPPAHHVTSGWSLSLNRPGPGRIAIPPQPDSSETSN